MNEKVEGLSFGELISNEKEPQEKITFTDINLLSHISVAITVKLGTTDIGLNKLFSLSSGDILSLNESLDSELVVEIDNKPFARGYLVAVDDNYGVEITQINAEFQLPEQE